jgi:uncharacterized protein
MEATTLGRTAIPVSRLGFGGAPAGLTNYLGSYHPQDAAQREQVIEAIQTALDLGITCFDTASAYGQGASETIFGEALRGRREAPFLAAKLLVNPSIHPSKLQNTSLASPPC